MSIISAWRSVSKLFILPFIPLTFIVAIVGFLSFLFLSYFSGFPSVYGFLCLLVWLRILFVVFIQGVFMVCLGWCLSWLVVSKLLTYGRLCRLHLGIGGVYCTLAGGVDCTLA